MFSIRLVMRLLVVFVFSCSMIVQLSADNSVSAGEFPAVEFVDSPQEFGSPALQCAKVQSGGFTAQDCFTKVGQICSEGNTDAIGPIDEGNNTSGYWLKIDRRSNCTSKIRIGVPDIACHILIAKDAAPSISCAAH